MDKTKLAKSDKGVMPESENVIQAGSGDIYNRHGGFTSEFLRQSNANYSMQSSEQKALRGGSRAALKTAQKLYDAGDFDGANILLQDAKKAEADEENAMEMYRKRKAAAPGIFATIWDEDIYGPPLLSIDEPESDEGKIDLEFAEPRAELTPKQLKQRAAKAAIALGEDPKELEVEMSDVQGEHQARQRAVYKDQNEFRAAKQTYIDELLKTRDPSKPMTMDEAQFIAGLSTSEFTPMDPEAMEKMYAQAVTTRLWGTGPSAQKVMEEDPEGFHNIQDAVEQNIQKFEIALRFKEDRQKAYDASTGIVGHIWNIGEQIIPIKSDWNKYDSSLSEWMPGSNVNEKIRNLWLQPPKVFAAKLQELYDTIAAHNPLDAQEMLASVISYSRMSEGMSNFFFGVDVATSLPVGWIFKAGKAVKVAAKTDPLYTDVVKFSAEKRSVTTSELQKQFGIKYNEAEKYIRQMIDEGIMSPEIFEGGRRAVLRADDPDYKPDSASGYTVRGDGIDLPEVQAAEAGKQTQKALSKEELRAEDVLPETGHQADGVDAHVEKIINAGDELPDVRDPSEFVNLSNRLNSFWNPRGWLLSGSRLGRESVDRIMNTVNKTRVAFMQSILEPGQAMRMTAEALAKAVAQKKLSMRDEFRFANDGVIDARWDVRTQSDNPETQVNELVMTIGTPDALAFNDYDWMVQTAKHTYKLRDGDWAPLPVGKEWYIQVKRPIDERDPSVTSAMITTENETPKSFANTLLGWWRNPDDLLSLFSRANRKAVTGAGQSVQHYFSAAAKEIGKLDRKQYKRLRRIMEVNRDDVAPDGRRGFWYNSVAEYEQKYYDLFKQYPTEKETQAYMLTREISDFDWAVKSLTILRDKSRQGIINVHTKLPKKTPFNDADDLDVQRMQDEGGPAGDVNFEATTMEDVSFEGKLVEGLPQWKQGDYDASVHIYKDGESVGEIKYLSDKADDEINRLINDEGYKVYQVADPINNPLGRGVDFVLLKNAQTSGLRADDMLPYRAGYHVEYAPGFYTKQGKFFRDGKGRLTFGGDTSVIYHVSEAAAKKYTQAFDKARMLLKEGKIDELKTLLGSSLPHSYEQFVRLFSDGTLDIDVPVLYTKSGQNTRDSARSGQGSFELYDTARDTYNSPYNLSSFVNRQFAQEKDFALPSAVKGSEGEPLHKFQGSKMIDPLSSLSRSMHNMVRMRVYDNYQYQALTSFVEEFANPSTLGGSVTKRSLDSVRQNPLAFITDPLWNEKAPRDKLAAAKNAHRSIVNLLGVQSELNRNVDWIVNKVVDSVFEKWGDGAASKAADFLHTYIRDPARYARSIAFHTKLGLFNPVQLFLQMQSVVHGAAITGNLKRSYEAMGAGMLMRYLSLTSNEDIVKAFAKKARVFGWKEDEFLESFENMKKAGIWHVEGEVADLNDIFHSKMFRGKGRQFLDKGVWFFQEGERFVRINAWNTAYKEWKVKNPGKAITDRERNEILRRYDDLAINMTRSSTGAWQQGILSIPAQFSTYQIHMAEQMLGKRLTVAEKTRVLAMYSALYGVPTGIAAGLAFWPFGQDIKQAAMERGIDINNGAMDVLLNGIMATGFEVVTGREYSFSERYGPNGLTLFKEALSGEKGLFDIFFGPSGQIGSDILAATDPVWKWVTSPLRADDQQFPLMIEDFGTIFRNISAVNNAYSMFYAMNAGKFISKNELFTAEVDAMDGIMKGIFGLDPRRITEAYIKIESMNEHREAQKAAQKEVVKNYRRMLENFHDPEAAAMYGRAAKAWIVMGGFRPDQMESIFREVTNNNTSLIEKVERQFLKYAPMYQIEDRFKMQQQQQQQRNAE